MGLNPLEQLNPVTMAAIAAIFLVTFFILRKVFFLPLIEAMERRAGKLESARATYEEAKALLERSRKEAAEIVTDMTEEAGRLSREVKEELIRIRALKIAEASAEADNILARGQKEVARIKEAEQAKLKEQLLACCRQTLFKMIGKVDEDALRIVVSRVLAAGEAAK